MVIFSLGIGQHNPAQAVDSIPTISQPLAGVADGLIAEDAITYTLQEVYWEDTVVFQAPDFCASEGLGVFSRMKIFERGPNRDQSGVELTSVTGAPSILWFLHAKGDFGFEFWQVCVTNPEFQTVVAIAVGFVKLHITDAPQVSPVTNFSVTPHDGSLDVSWTPVDHTIGYLAKATKVSDGSSTPGCLVTNRSNCTITGLTVGETYTVKITSIPHGTQNSVALSAASSPIRAADPIYAQGTILSNWHVGDTVTATAYYTGGTASQFEYFWYRCNSAIPETIAEPVGCSLISVGTSNVYTLTSADFGKYVSVFVKASNAYVFGTKTIANLQQTLAAPTPLAVSGSLISNWKVGDTVVFSPMISGTPTHTDIQWFRCDNAVVALNSQPNCQMIFGQSGYTYVLTSSDVDKYVTAFIHVTNSVSDVMKTFANSRATAVSVNPTPGASTSPSPGASGTPSPSPSATDDGKPKVTPMPIQEVPLTGGVTIVISGANLGTVTSVTVNGVVARIVSSTDQALVVEIPSGTRPGVAEVVIAGAKGTVTSTNAVSYAGGTQAKLVSKNLAIKGFASTAISLSASHKTQIRTFLLGKSGYSNLSCVGDVTGVKKSNTQIKYALARAKAACTFAKALMPGLKITSSGKQSKTTGAVSRIVGLSLTN